MPETFSISDVEIFSTGTWNGDHYTGADLDAIVSSFREVGNQLKPYVKLGHGGKQSLLKEDELPAAGWITDLRRVGDKIKADINGIPKKIYELMKSGGYKRVSSEIYWNLSIGGKVYPYALKAIAFLGGTTPAVQNLDDILALYDGAQAARAYETEAAVKSYELENKMDELQKANDEIAALKVQIEAKTAEAKVFSDEVAALKADNERVKVESSEFKTRAESAEAKLSEYSDKALKSEIESEIGKLIADKKIMPAQKDAAYALMLGSRKGQVKAYAADGSEKPMADVVAEFFKNASEVHINTEHESETGSDSRLDIADEAKKYSIENKVSYKEALVAVEKSRKAK